MRATKYDDLVVWKKSMNLIQAVYSVTSHFPKDERYGLAAQMRRSAISIASNIAEGHGRWSTREFLHHLSFAYGSLIEIETQIRISGMLEFVRAAETKSLLARTAEVGRMLNGLRRYLSTRSKDVRESPTPGN